MDRHQFLGYIPGNSFIHKLNGASKLLFFVFVSIAGMITYDTRFLLGVGLSSLILLRFSGIKYSQIKFILKFMLVFSLINLTAVYLFQPSYGEQLYHSREVLFGSGYLTFTAQEGFYLFNLILKYFVTFPLAILFLLTTNPSEFASSLNKIGVSSKIAYAVALTLRYIPDIQDEFFAISQAQQARGYEVSRKAGLIKRLKGIIQIIFPLIFSSLETIETVSTAMELRRFGKSKQRTWYMYRAFSRKDIAVVILALLLLLLVFFLFYVNHGRFYNPFV